MATLVLTAVGSAIGGPIGGAIGAVLGQQVDARIFAPRARHGPRLGDLAVQTSTYGGAIPKIFGTMRVAGTVIWATDLQEHRSTGGGGKGRPKTVEYSYSASFAVALSGRPIRGVGRIWAEGKLLRGGAGDFKAATGFRLHPGGEDQAADPLLAAAEGIGGTPAYRGIAYAVFEDLDLTDFGNRIPSLTFEVEADEGPVAIGAIAEELSGGEVIGGETPALGGYAASGDSVRGAIESMAEVVPLSLAEREGALILESGSGTSAVFLERGGQGCNVEGAGGRTALTRRGAAEVPGEVSIAYYDFERDYQTGLQRAKRAEASGPAERHALAAVLTAGDAKALAERRLASLWAGRSRAKVHLAWRLGGIRPGASVVIEGEPGRWRVERWSLEHMVVGLELVSLPAGGGAVLPPASPGRSTAQPDALHGPTTLLLLDLPLGADKLPTRPYLLVAAAGQEAGWRGAALLASYDGGDSWEPAGRTAAPAVMGSAVTALAPAGSTLIDLRGQVEVELLNESMWLEARSDDALAGGANLAALGNELIQFGGAEPLGGGRFRLTRLLRGRWGTEWAAAGHSAGEGFAMIRQETLAVVEPPAGRVGGEARLLATGIGDGGEGVPAVRAINGEATRPPSPVHLQAETGPDGDIVIGWVRRSRLGWSWTDEADTPLGEESEAYSLLLSGASFERTVTLVEPGYHYSLAEQLEDGLAGALTIRVRQLGTASASRPAEIIFG